MNNVEYFQQILSEDARLVNSEIDKFFKEKIAQRSSLFDDSLSQDDLHRIRHYMEGGKRLRPSALIEAYLGVGGSDKEKITRASLSVEFLHNSTLIHDDKMDDSDYRHGRPTIHKQYEADYRKFGAGRRGQEAYGMCMAVIAGNISYVWGLQALNSAGFEPTQICDAINVWSNAYEIVNYGQIKDIRFEEMRRQVTNEENVGMVELKTAALFDASVQIGLIFGNATQIQREKFQKYTYHVAIGFQISDDILGTFGDPKKTGKPINDDLREGKKTWFVNKAMEVLQKEGSPQLKELERIIGNWYASNEDFDKAREIIIKTGAVEDAKRAAREFAETAKKNLYEIPGLEERCVRFFDGCADFVTARER
jgi:geranylgeranyl diphosphate synthase type I